MKKIKIYLAGVFALALTISCSKDDDQNQSSDNEMLRTSSVIEQINENDFQAGTETASDNSSLRTSGLASSSTVAPCATVTASSLTTFPRTFTIDFGTGCTHNGLTRSGILTITLSGPLMQAGSEMTITRNNYFINGYHVEGTVVYLNQTTNPSIPQWTRTVTNGVLTTPSGLVYNHSGQRTVRQIEGAGTLVLGDNVYEVTAGSHTITRPNGTTLTSTVITPLIKQYACLYISQGVLHLEGTVLNGDLDYGNNTCDNQAVFTNSQGQSTTINLW
jgi:hypothetical protein